MRRTLLVTIDFPPRRGGVARYLDAFARVWRDRVTVWAPPAHGSESVDAAAGYPVIRRELLFRSLWPKWKLTTLRLMWEARSYDTVVTSHVLPIGTACWVASWFTRKPYLVMVHGLDIATAMRSPIKKWLTSRVLRAAEAVVANSQALEREVRERFQLERTLVVYPCIQPLEQITRPTHDGHVRLLTVARLVSRKGHVRVLEAIAQLRDRGVVPEYTIVGSGPEENRIRERVKELRLESQVKFLGDISDADLSAQYRQSDIFVMPVVQDPVDREGFGTVYLEAALHHLPSIATNMPGVDEAVLHEETGLLVPDGDIGALSNAIQRLVDDSALRQRLGKQAHDRTVNDFTCERQFGKLSAFL